MSKLMLKLMVKKEMAKMNLLNFAQQIKSEEGDTNFISIIIILGIVIILVGIFVGFKDTIITTIENIVSGFSADSLGKS
ncbi:MAG: hypothetical protein ACI4HO_02485 [Ruminococcus sp.]